MTSEHDNQSLRAIEWRALLVLLSFIGAAFLKVLAARYLILGSGTWNGVALDLLFICMVFSAADLFFADMRLRAMLVVDVAVSILLLGIGMYSAYYQMLPTKQALAAFGQAAEVSTSIMNLLNPAFLLLFVDIPIFAWWAMRARARGVDPVTGKRPGSAPVPGLRTPYVYQRRAVYVVGVVAAVVFAFGVQQARLVDLADGKAVARQRGVATYLVADLVGEMSDPSALEAEIPGSVADRIRSEVGTGTAGSVPGFTTGSAAGKNVIVIQVEALQAVAVGLEVGGVEVTPNLNRLIAQSWYFPNHFSGVGRGTTSDAEFLANTSLYPPMDGAASLMYADRELPSLPRMLRERGYGAFTFHTNDVEYWNRSQLYPAIGFTRHFDKKFFGTADTIAFGASDRVLFDKTLAQLSAYHNDQKPFYAQIVTMSSHFPFTEVPSNRRKVPIVDPYTGTIEGDYFTEIHYADAEIGRFVDELERTGLLEDSVLVIYGDHFGLPKARNSREQRVLDTLFAGGYGEVDRANTPLIIHLPGQTDARTVNTPVGQLDLMPSIADALGLDLSGTACFGRSVFSAGPRFFSAGGLLPVGAYFDESVLYIPGNDFESGTVYDVATRQQVGIERASKAKYLKTKDLLALSSGYVSGLPIRSDFDPDAKTILPSK